MRIENANAPDVLKRILSAYSFTMQKELAERLEIAKSNVAGWLQRGQIPGNVILQCALDTGADVNWIVTGELAKANSELLTPKIKGKVLFDEIMSNGGRAVLRRILDAYGFTTQKQLCDLLGLSSGTVSTWVRRNFFPGDVVVTCALDTGVSLEWLATGKTYETGNDLTISNDTVSTLERYLITSGVLLKSGVWLADKSLTISLSTNSGVVENNNEFYLVDFEIRKFSNGRWLISIDENYDIYDVTRVPGNKVILRSKGIEFECDINAVVCSGQVKKTIENN